MGHPAQVPQASACPNYLPRVPAPILPPSHCFRSAVQSTGLPVVVDFYSDGCGPCRMMAPIYKQMAQEYAGRAVFTKVDVNAVNIGQQIRSMPTFQFWMNGKKMQEFSGGDEGSLRRITQDLARKARAMNMEITAENLFEFYKVHDKSKTLKDCQKLLSRNIPIDKLVASLRQKYKAKPKLTQKDRRKKKKKGDKGKYVDGSVRLELADLEELEEMVRKVKVESGQLEEDGGGAPALFFVAASAAQQQPRLASARRAAPRRVHHDDA